MGGEWRIFLGEAALTKERWLLLVEELKNAPRPLGLKFRRFHKRLYAKPVTVPGVATAEGDPQEADDTQEKLYHRPRDEIEKDDDMNIKTLIKQMRLCEPRSP